MSSFSAPLPMTSALPLAPPPSVAPLGPPAAVLVPPAGVAGLSAPAPMNPASVSAPASTIAARPQTTAAPSTTAAVKQQGSGHQMFQQMFALLKQMLPPEQYAALHSEMRNGNGNDIKSIVDIIKRIAGDAIFASVIQKMDLTRNHSAAAGSLGIVKTEPATNAATTAAPMARPMPVARPQVPAATPQPTVTATMATMSTTPQATVSAPMAAPTTAAQRPTLVTATPPASMNNAVKAEPTPTPATAASTTTSTTAPAAATSTSGSTDSQEKIQFAKKLLFHASTCALPPGVCQVKRCDDVRRVFKHSVSCGGARGCSHCKQLKALVEYHAKECLVAVGEHCKIPFCDAIRQQNAAARARAASAGAAGTTATTTPSTAAHAAAPTSSVMSDDDEDNTPLASAVKSKKPKAKSPKASPAASTSSTTSASGTAATTAKKKPTPTTTTKPITPPTTGATASSAALGGAAAAQQAKPKASSAQAQEYGRLLQLILHVEKCKTSVCAVGDECVEAKSLLRQINSPDAPLRAHTYKKVYAHYKVCVAKNNTQNCPMCRIGLMPIETSSDASGGAGAGSGAPASLTATGSATSVTTSTPAPASSPTVSSLKRTNSSVASPRSPNKKPRTTPGKTTTASGKAGESTTANASSTGAGDQPGSDLAQASRNDLRKEEDVLTHTAIDLNSERRAMLHGGRRVERLPCQKEVWATHDLFNSATLTKHMEAVARQNGVTLAPGKAAAATQIMAHALQEYLKQVMEEMAEAAKVRGDAASQTLDMLMKKDLGAAAMAKRELTSTDILRVSCEDSFARLRMEDLALRSKLLEDAKREELLEKERAKKRKKVDRVKQQAQEEKDEAEMDVDELAVSDLKDKLLRDDKEGVAHVEGRVNESLVTRPTRRVDDQVTMEDATFWLQNQKAYVAPKLFVRAEAARVITKALS